MAVNSQCPLLVIGRGAFHLSITQILYFNAAYDVLLIQVLYNQNIR